MIRLPLGAEEHGRRRLVQAPILSCRHDADYLVAHRGAVNANADELSERHAVAPEATRHGLVHDRDWRCPFVVADGELATLQQTRPNRLEECRPDVERLEVELLLATRKRHAGHLDADHDL